MPRSCSGGRGVLYLGHGAPYAIGALSVILLITIRYEINALITGLVGVPLIG